MVIHFFLLILLATVAMSAPQHRQLRLEEEWRPAPARDLSKYKPKYAVAPSRSQPLDWEEQIAVVNKAAKLTSKTSFAPRNGLKPFNEVECGIERPFAKTLIVGGQEAEEHQWPWQVALFIDDAWFCGGSLISDQYVLTAAHCADNAMYFDIMAGAYNVRAPSELHRVEITSYEGWTHPQWNPSDLSNDIALIKLPSPIEWNNYIKPACLPDIGDPSTGDLVTITGWGKSSDSASGISPVLRQVEDVPVISNEGCNEVYGIIGPGVFCTDTTGGKGSCNGDSGGPANTVCGIKSRSPGDKWKQVGVVSFGPSSGCEVGLPAGFTSVAYYLDWILSFASTAQDCYS